jgi:hypothetical protein
MMASPSDGDESLCSFKSLVDLDLPEIPPPVGVLIE